jgi:DNA helicase HerA-like ATPase
MEADSSQESSTRIGALVKVQVGDADVVGTVRAVQLEHGPPPHQVLVVDLLGELSPSGRSWATFTRGVTDYPTPGSPVFAASEQDFSAIYARSSRSSVRIGTLDQDKARPAFLMVDELLTKHFAVLGSTGSGKSCAVTLILSAILSENPNAHIILLDPHNEYATAFGDQAEVVNVDNLQLPLWLFDLEESVRILVRGGTPEEQQSQAMIIKDAITQARRRYADDRSVPTAITVDTPVPYRISDLLSFINDAMGRVNRSDTSMPYMRLRTRIESLRDDRRFSFMFSDWIATRDVLSEVVGRLLRIPVKGKPLTILDLSGVPAEVSDVVVALICRMMFDFSLWSDRKRMPPILLVCEEAHRYVPADTSVGFAAAARAVSRLAKEGRKYGLSIALVSQRPAELSPYALSQCGTIFALRLSNDLDQRFVERTLPDAATGMLAALPSMRTQQAIVSGEGVPVPMKIRFDNLPPERRPRSDSAEFSKSWQDDSADDAFREDTIQRWRLQSRALMNGRAPTNGESPR